MILHLFLFFAATTAILRNPNRCFFKTFGPRDGEAVGFARNSSLTSTHVECLKKCFVNRKCRFFTYNNQTKLCALNPRFGSKLSLSVDILGFAFKKVCLGPSLDRAKEIFLRKAEILKGHLLRVAQWLESRLRAILIPLPPFEDQFFEGERKMRDAPLAGNPCYERTPGKVLIGVVDQLVQDIGTAEQCEELCNTVNSDKEGQCKSVMYYPKEKECIVAAETRREMPELFTDDKNAIYIENVCVGGKTPPLIPTDNLSEKIAVKPPLAPPPISETKDYGSEAEFVSIKTPVKIESSGYDTGIPSAVPHFPAPMPPAPSTQPPLIVVPDAKPHVSVHTHSETRRIETPTMIEPKVIDTYNMIPRKTVPNDVQPYRRRLRDPKINKCFKQIFAKDVVNERVLRSYSLEQCIDICRLCENCLNGRKCNRVAFSIVNHFCALGSTLLLSPTSPQLSDSAFVQFKRTHC